jgi:hypothetical protein
MSSSYIVDEIFTLLELETKESWLLFLEECDNNQKSSFLTQTDMKFLKGNIKVSHIDKNKIKEDHKKIFEFLTYKISEVVKEKMALHKNYQSFNQVFSLISYNDSKAIDLEVLQNTIMICRDNQNNSNVHMSFLKKMYQNLTDLGLI